MKEIFVKVFDELTTVELYDIIKARVDVFVVEQTCPYPELDGIDFKSSHIWIEENLQIVAYCRVFYRDEHTAQIGRVLSLIRNKNYGYEVMVKGIEICRQMDNIKQIYIEAQCYAIGFYEKFGFKVVSEPFDEDGIDHVQMILEVA